MNRPAPNGPSQSPADVPGIQMPATRVVERPAADRSGWAAVAVAVALLVLAAVGAGGGFILGGGAGGVLLGACVLLFLTAVVLAAGLTAVAPGQARVVQLLGRYRGTIGTDGLRWVNPLTSGASISTRIRNHETGGAKVNDADGDGQLSLRDNADEVTETLSSKIAARVESAGVRIVEGAVGMVESALARLAEHDVVELDEKRKATMVSNLLVVLCGNRDAQPVVLAGSLY
jgi:regulator of protease activity HflC (stomatin/prohibitin superfamily)